LSFQILNIGDVTTWMNHEMREDEDGFVTKSILCMPIVNGQKTVIGVAQLINKVLFARRLQVSKNIY
jgi:cGMP-specific 3',5'-cyclic phosphodiesterase